MTTILIIEDNPGHLRLAAVLVKRAGYAVLSAGDAEVGLRLAREQPPDLILMDIKLPGMDGFAATRELKQDSTTRAIPVIAMTSFLNIDSERDARAAGCAGFIAKPFHYADLLAALTAALKEGR